MLEFVITKTLKVEQNLGGRGREGGAVTLKDVYLLRQSTLLWIAVGLCKWWLSVAQLDKATPASVHKLSRRYWSIGVGCMSVTLYQRLQPLHDQFTSEVARDLVCVS